MSMFHVPAFPPFLPSLLPLLTLLPPSFVSAFRFYFTLTLIYMFLLCAALPASSACQTCNLHPSSSSSSCRLSADLLAVSSAVSVVGERLFKYIKRSLPAGFIVASLAAFSLYSAQWFNVHLFAIYIPVYLALECSLDSSSFIYLK